MSPIAELIEVSPKDIATARAIISPWGPDKAYKATATEDQLSAFKAWCCALVVKFKVRKPTLTGTAAKAILAWDLDGCDDRVSILVVKGKSWVAHFVSTDKTQNTSESGTEDDLDRLVELLQRWGLGLRGPKQNADRLKVEGTITSVENAGRTDWCPNWDVFRFSLKGHKYRYHSTSPRFAAMEVGDELIFTMPVRVDGTQELFDGSVFCRRIKIVEVLRGGVDILRQLDEPPTSKPDGWLMFHDAWVKPEDIVAMVTYSGRAELVFASRKKMDLPYRLVRDFEDLLEDSGFANFCAPGNGEAWVKASAVTAIYLDDDYTRIRVSPFDTIAVDHEAEYIAERMLYARTEGRRFVRMRLINDKLAKLASLAEAK